MGEFDPEILCSSCDNTLGRYDDYAVEFCRKLDATRHGRTGELFNHTPFDGATFARFILAVLWRASISKRASWDGINLGPYENRARDVLFDGEHSLKLPGYEVVVGRYVSDEHDARRFYSLPVKFRSPSFNAFSFAVGGFQVIAKLDQRPFPPMFRGLEINESRSLTGYLTKLEDSLEFKWLLDCARAERRKRAGMEASTLAG